MFCFFLHHVVQKQSVGQIQFQHYPGEKNKKLRTAEISEHLEFLRKTL